MMVTRATPADAGLLAVIHSECFPPAEAWGPDVFTLQLAMPGVSGLVHPDGGFVLLRVAADEAEILTLAVVPAARRAGLGRALMRAAANTAYDAGASALFLEVAVPNTPARRLYETSGFVQAGIRPGYYADGSDALVLRLDLSTCR